MNPTTPQPIGHIIDAAGVTASLKPDDIVSDVLVLLRVITADGHVQVEWHHGDGTDWITRRGLIETARDVLRTSADVGETRG